MIRLRHVALSLLLLAAATQHATSAPLWMYNVHSKEELRIPTPPPSRVSTRDWRRANHFFRSRKANKRRTTHPRLLRTLAHIQSHFGGKRIEIVSGYRAPVPGDTLNSYHQVGRAADFRIVGVSKETLFAYCQSLPKLGCGYYPNARFVHVDVRGTATVWVDRSPPGQPRDYVPAARRWLRARGL